MECVTKKNYLLEIKSHNDENSFQKEIEKKEWMKWSVFHIIWVKNQALSSPMKWKELGIGKDDDNILWKVKY